MFTDLVYRLVLCCFVSMVTDNFLFLKCLGSNSCLTGNQSLTSLIWKPQQNPAPKRVKSKWIVNIS